MDNSIDHVYLFSPIVGKNNSFPKYGAALLEVDIEKAIKCDMEKYDANYGKYDEYITDRVSSKDICKIYIPKIFSYKLDLPKAVIDKVVWCDMKAQVYGDNGLEDIDEILLKRFSMTAEIRSAQTFNYFRGLNEDNTMIDLYDVEYDLKGGISLEENYRISFIGIRNSKSVDIHAANIDDAFNKAYRMPESKSGKYTDVSIGEIPKEPSVIGVEFKYTDTAIKKDFRGYLFIKANNEAEAVNYYNEYYKGQRFWFNAGEIVEDGKCIRGDVVGTYFAACPGYDADATLKTENLNKKHHR